MRFVHVTHDNIVELNWMWLPTWIGQNSHLKKELEEELNHFIAQNSLQSLDERALGHINAKVRAFLAKKFPAPKGLMDYLDALEHVEDGSSEANEG